VSEPTENPPASRLASVQELKEFLYDQGGTLDPDIAGLFLDTASEQISSEFDRQFYPSGPETRTIYLDGCTFARIPELRADTDTALLLDGHPITSTRYRLLSRRGHPAHAIVLTSPGFHLQITGNWGFDPVPQAIKHGVLVCAARAAFKRQARQADVQQDIDTGVVTQYFSGLPSQVRALASSYKLVGLGG
jgi:hypothetical protein